MKQREGYKVIISKDAEERIKKEQCPGCGKPIKSWTRRQDWRCCSTECTQKYVKEMVCYGWPELRIKAFKRDNYTCAKCNYRPVTTKISTHGYYKTGEEFLQGQFILQDDGNPEIINDNPPTIRFFDSTELVGDHIIPIAIGGGEWDLDNIQTLCVKCDKVKTRNDMKDIAKERRREKLLAKGQTFL